MTVALVTGVAGFIGRHVAAELVRAGHTVYGSGRSSNPPPELAELGLAGWSGGGVTVDSLLSLPTHFDAVIHCAGSGSVPRSLEEPDFDFDSNVLTTRAVLDYARRRGRPKVVLLSSAGVYGAVRDLPIASTAPCNPISPYGMNKRIGEILGLQYARHFGVPVAIIRLFSVYGEGLRKQLLWDACRKLTGGDHTFAGTGEETRDWIHVEDASRLIAASVVAARTGDPITINGGCGTSHSIRHVVELLADRLKIQAPLTFSGISRRGDPQHYVADIGDALGLGWRPCVPFEDGVTRYVDWYRTSSADSASPVVPPRVTGVTL